MVELDMSIAICKLCLINRNKQVEIVPVKNCNGFWIECPECHAMEKISNSILWNEIDKRIHRVDRLGRVII